MAVVAYAPASIGNVSVGFDVLGAALAPIDGALLGDRVEVHAAEQAFSLSCRGRFAHKLPAEAEKNIVYDCYLGYAAETTRPADSSVAHGAGKEFANRFWVGL